MNRKGVTTPVLLVGEFILIGILILTFTTLTSTASNPDFLEKTLTADDIAKTIDIVQSVAPDVYYEYPENKEGYNVKLDSVSVNLLELNQEEITDSFSPNKRYYSHSNNMDIQTGNEVDVSYFYIEKNDNQISLSDFTVKDGTVLTKTSKSKPNISIEYLPTNNLGKNMLFDKLVLVVQSELESNFEISDVNDLVIRFSINKENKDNNIYYSQLNSLDTKPISLNLQELLYNRLNLNTVPLSKDYGQEMVVELVLNGSEESLRFIQDDDQRKIMGLLIAYAIGEYYGVES